MHVLFLAPETHVYNHEFIRGLKESGARVSAAGHAPKEKLAARLRELLDAYEPVRSLFDPAQVLEAARRLGSRAPLTRVETIDEPLVIPAAELRESLGLPGLSKRTATLCRDKAAMKEFLRGHGVPCAQSIAVSSEQEALAFVERVGYPVIVKPRAGFGSLGTHKVENAAELAKRLDDGRKAGGLLAIEEFVDGHEGFYDTLVADGRIVHDFASHYFPGCLAALGDRRITPQIAHTNRIETADYAELRRLGETVNAALGLDRTATHMEWFFGSKGLRFSEIGARPAGEKIWDLYRVAHELDVYREWASVVLFGKTREKPSGRFSTGSIQIRPDRDGRYLGHDGLQEAQRQCGEWIYEAEIPAPGSPTLPLEKGWLVNTWIRLRHPDFDTLRGMMDFLGRTVKAYAG
jgi:biotin carboxylase